MSILFCNISWMSEYKGHHRIDEVEDHPQRGGKWVIENGTAHECCNFYPNNTGTVYGHVETWKGDESGYDTQIKIEKLGAEIDAPFIDGVTVVWIATHEAGGRRVVGWYKNARVYRLRQHFDDYPTNQHRRDNVNSYRVTAKKSDTFCVPEYSRDMELGKGEGWPGHNQLFYPENYSSNREMAIFLDALDSYISFEHQGVAGSNLFNFNPESSGESLVYLKNARHMRRTHGKVVNELHSVLKKRFKLLDIWNNQKIDLAISKNKKLLKLFEIKTGNDTQSIYTGIGQLMFHSEGKEDIEKVLVLPKSEKGYKKLYPLFHNLGIWIAEYHIDEQDIVTFTNIPN